MTKTCQLVVIALAVVCSLLTPNRLSAANTIGIGNLQSAVKDSITASGTYTLDAGWTVNSITLYAFPAAGGSQISQQCPMWKNGKWAPTVINGLTSNVKYDVYVQMVISNGANMQTINSPVSKITVAACSIQPSGF